MAGNFTGIGFELNTSIKLTPAQLRTIEILQMSNAELQQMISNELLENPVLEYASADADASAQAPESDSDSSYDSDDFDKYDSYDRCDQYTRPVSSGLSVGASKAAEFEAFYQSSETLKDHLLSQLMGSVCCDNVRDAAEFIIYSLDDNGYIDISLEEIAADCSHTLEEISAALDIVRSMDPPGLAAWTLEECLRLQLDPECEQYDDICRVIESMLHEVATGDIRKISKTLEIEPDKVARIISVIKSLDPKPGARFSDGSAMQYVIPDIDVEVIAGSAIVHMIDTGMPLGLSSYYCNLMRTTDNKEVLQYLKKKIEGANQLIENIEQRKRTVESVTLAILERQRHFLEPGNKILEPLTMQQIADDIGVHVYTVSRAVRGKYIRFPTATYPLKYFFTNEVGGVSRDSIYSKIRQIIEEENHAKPLSDQEIADILLTRGVKASRRTVAKYRDSMGILPKSLRKQI